MTLTALAQDLLGLFLPRGCLGCGERIPPEDPQDLVCTGCRGRLKPPPPPFCQRCQLPLGTGHAPGEACLECGPWPAILVWARAACVLNEPAGALVHALKYGGWRALAGPMAERMWAQLPPGLGDALVVPVPTTPWRRRTRGYNQAEVLAREVAAKGSLHLLEALRRSAGGTQVHLGPRAREANVRGKFSLASGARSQIRGREVILVDDVLTTGATARAAARTLEAGGAASIRLLTFARSLPFHERGMG